jgi:WD40 repeat protein
MDNSIILWDVSVPSEPKRIGQPFSNHTNGVISVAFSPDGEKLVSSSLDETVILWDISRPETPKQIGPPLPKYSDIFSRLESDGSMIGWSVIFSPDGSMLASGCMSFIILWEVNAPESPILIDMPLGFHDYQEKHSDLITGLAFSPDGRTLASGSWDNTIILWDLSVPGEPKSIGQPLKGHSDIVWSLSFSPDGKILASGSSDNTVILWDVTSPSAPLRLGQPLSGHSGVVMDVSFNPNGRILASGSNDFTVILWDVGLEAWKTRACNIAGRNLTQEEWDLYLPFYDYQQTCPQFP